MRLAFCYITPFHPNKGGIGRATDALTREFQHRGHEVFYLIYPSGMTIRHEYDYPAPLEYLPSEELLSEANITSYFHFLKKNRIDIVINQSGNFDDSRLWLKCKEIGIPVISVLHTYPSNAYKYIWQLIVEPLRDTTLKEQAKRVARMILYPRIKHKSLTSVRKEFERMVPETDLICALSSNSFRELDALCPGYSSKYRFIPNPNPYPRQPLRQKKKQILFVALFGNVKREDWMARIWAKIAADYPDWKLVMVGYGPEGRLKRLNKILKGVSNVELVGYAESKPYQEESAIVCLTSVSEGWPMVLIEGMQCGCVPIAYNSFASASDIIQPGFNGELIAPFDEQKYVGHLRHLIENDEYRQQLAANAEESVRKFEITNVADRWEDLFDELIKRKKHVE